MNKGHFSKKRKRHTNGQQEYEKCSSWIVREIQVKTTMRSDLSLLEWSSREDKRQQVSQGCEGKGALQSWECNLAQAPELPCGPWWSVVTGCMSKEETKSGYEREAALPCSFQHHSPYPRFWINLSIHEQVDGQRKCAMYSQRNSRQPLKGREFWHLYTMDEPRGPCVR
jgi:hypothetical protein